MRRERGSVLLQVLLLTVVASLMCAAVLRARFQPALTAASGVELVSSGLEAQAAVNRVTEVWARLGVCASDRRSGVTCAGAGCACSCAVSMGPESRENRSGLSAARVTSSSSGGACALTTVSQ